jgi:glycosyltransferase involved in cell wall biosynthesis
MTELLEDLTIICLASSTWDAVNRVNCHHVMERLARRNRVLFVETVGARRLQARDWRKVLARLRRASGARPRLTPPPSMRVVSPLIFPDYGSPAAYRLNTVLLRAQIGRALPSDWRGRPTVLWAFLPYHAGLLGAFREQLQLYHCVDEYAENPGVAARFWIGLEAELATRAQAVLTTSKPLFEAKRRFNSSTYYLPNVADIDHFMLARRPNLAEPSDTTAIPKPIMMFCGNVSAYKVNLNMVNQVAGENPTWSFVFIGPVGHGDPRTRIAGLTEHPNVFILGERPYDQLPAYFKSADACWIPYNVNRSTTGSFPMKFFEYLAAGKPVVSSDLPSLGEFSDYYLPGNSAEEIGRLLRSPSSLARPPLARSDLEPFSWDSRMREIESIVARHLAASAPRSSLSARTSRFIQTERECLAGRCSDEWGSSSRSHADRAGARLPGPRPRW